MDSPLDAVTTLCYVMQGGTVPDRWTETARTETAGPTKESDSSQSFAFHANIDLIQWLLFLVAMATRMWRLDHPRGVV